MKDELGEIKNYTASLRVDPNTKLIFCKAHHVPYALQEKVDKELDRLESLGTIKPIQYLEWAAPIIKTHQVIHLCGNYKMTMNKCTNLDSYPILKIEDLYTKLSQRRKLRKLDLRPAFLQVLLHKDSKKFLMINTLQDLYQFNRLSFGVVCPWHISMLHEQGSSDAEHLDNLDSLEKTLSLWTQSQTPSVTYLGHQIDSQGLHPTEDKIQAIRDAPAPRNVTELKAFLQLFQFYSRYIPNVADKLYRLLQRASLEGGKQITLSCFNK